MSKLTLKPLELFEGWQVVDKDDNVIFDNQTYYPTHLSREWAERIVAAVNAATQETEEPLPRGSPMTTPSTSAQWKLVPVEPTPEMYIKGGIAIADAKPTAETYADEASACYAAMLTASPSPAASPASPSGPSYVVNCCNCGRIVDTREKDEGGDGFGAELSDGRWTCSPECWDAVVEPEALAKPASEPAGGSVTLTRQQIDGLLRAAYPLATAPERAGALEAALSSSAGPAVVAVSLADLDQWRRDWLDENDPKDDTDCVTPFDAYLYAHPAPATVEMRAGIYIASKTTHGARWRALRASGVPIISTWIDEAEAGATSNWPDLWHRCVREARQAAVTIVYREEGEVLKGAFIEMGAALSAGRTVFAVGCDEFSVRHHMRVVPCASLEEALDLARAALAPATEGSKKT